MDSSDPARASDMTRPTAISLALVLAFSLAPVVGQTAQADDLRDKKRHIDAKVDDAEDEVHSFNKKLARATREVMDSRAQLPAAQANLDRAMAAKAKAESANTKAASDLKQAAVEVHLAEQRLATLERQLAELRASVGDFARRAYQLGPFAEVEMLLDAKDPYDFTGRLAAIRSVSRSKQDKLGEMNLQRAEFARQEVRLEALRDVAKDKKALAEARVAEAKAAAEGAIAAKDLVDALVARERSALRSVKSQRAAVKAQYDRLAAEQEQIQRQIVAAAKRLEKSTGVKTGTGGSALDSGTQWYFPLPGYAIGSDAGWRFHPILHYVRCHAGADIGAPQGVPIHAVESGTVIQAGYSGGYGNMTVISHGGGLTSGYAHQSSIVVSSGQRVSRGQVIGFVGSTGLSTGAHLHFEARVNGAPYSPKGWFGQGPKAAVCV